MFDHFFSDLLLGYYRGRDAVLEFMAFYVENVNHSELVLKKRLILLLINIKCILINFDNGDLCITTK